MCTCPCSTIHNYGGGPLICAKNSESWIINKSYMSRLVTNPLHLHPATNKLIWLDCTCRYDAWRSHDIVSISSTITFVNKISFSFIPAGSANNIYTAQQTQTSLTSLLLLYLHIQQHGCEWLINLRLDWVVLTKVVRMIYPMAGKSPAISTFSVSWCTSFASIRSPAWPRISYWRRIEELDESERSQICTYFCIV